MTGDGAPVDLGVCLTHEQLVNDMRLDQITPDVGKPLPGDDALVEQPDIVDIATRPETHAALVTLAASSSANVLCQKPLAPTLAAYDSMVSGQVVRTANL